MFSNLIYCIAELISDFRWMSNMQFQCTASENEINLKCNKLNKLNKLKFGQIYIVQVKYYIFVSRGL